MQVQPSLLCADLSSGRTSFSSAGVTGDCESNFMIWSTVEGSIFILFEYCFFTKDSNFVTVMALLSPFLFRF